MKYITKHMSRIVQVARPVTEHTARWALIALGACFFLLELDYMWSGKIYHAWTWFWRNVVVVHPTIPYWLGVLSYHLVLRHQKRIQNGLPILQPDKPNKSKDPTPLNMNGPEMDEIKRKLTTTGGEQKDG